MTASVPITNELKPETIKWLREDNGLITLNSSLYTGIHRLSIRARDFYDNPDYDDNVSLLNRNDNNGINRSEDFLDRYSQLRKGMFAIGVNVTTAKGKKTIKWEDYDDEEYDREVAETIIHCKLHVAFEKSFYAKDIFDSLSEESQSLIAELAIMDLLVGESNPLQQDDAVCCKTEKITSEGSATYYELWGQEICPDEVNYKFSIVCESDKYIINEIAGRWYNEVRDLVSKSNPNIRRERGRAREALPKRFKGLCKSKWEVQMAEILTERGYFVILEPNVIMPENMLETRRQPDILVCKKGRMMAIEIDDSSHLVKGGRRNGGGYPNTTKYKRDRKQDRVFLSNGIPLIRVYYDEFRNSPHQIVSDLEGMYEGLGGPRITFM